MKAVVRGLFIALLGCISAVAYAVPPIAYDGWVVSGGTIDASSLCTGTITCQTMVSEDGFLEQKVVDTSNNTKFIRIIMTDPGEDGDPTLTGVSADLEYTYETYTPVMTNDECNNAIVTNFGQDCQGVAAKMVIRDVSEDFEAVSELQRNFPKGLDYPNYADMYNMKLTQSLGSVDPDFSNDFLFIKYSKWECNVGFPCDGYGEVGHILNIDQDVFTGDTATGDTAREKFAYRDLGGFVGRDNVGCTFFNQCDPMLTASSMTLDGNTVSWGTSDFISTTWVAETSNSGAQNGFNYQKVENDSTSSSAFQDSLAYLDMSGPASGTVLDPFDWDSNFGTQPQLTE